MRVPTRWRKRSADQDADNVHDAQKVRGGVISGRVLTVLLISLPVAFIAMFLIWLYFMGTSAPPPETTG